MNHTINLFPLFAKNLCVGNLGCTQPELNLILTMLKKEDYEDLNNVSDKFMRGDDLCETSKNFYILEQECFIFLKNKILKYVNDFFKTKLFFNKNNFTITTSWIAKTPPGKLSHWHNHNNCYYSGVFYIDTAKECGDIIFSTFDSNIFSIQSTEINQYNSKVFSVPVENDRIVLFPAEIYHKISKNNSNKDRYSIAFNIMPTGKIGHNDSCLIYNP